MGRQSHSADEERDLVAKRVEYLEAMLDASYRKTEIEDELDAPRSTVDRAVRNLETHGLVKRVDGEYTTTRTGEIAFERYEEYVDFSDTVCRAKDLLNEIDDDIELPHALFRDAHVNVPEPDFPEAPVLNPNEMVADSPYLHGLAPVVLSYFPDSISDMLNQGDQEFEIVLTQEVLKTVRSEFPSDFELATDFPDQLDLHVSEEELPFALWLIEDDGIEHLGITVYNEIGAVGSIVSADQEAVAWGREFYRSYRENAKRLEL
jgi:predicted transcriptional regulator